MLSRFCLNQPPPELWVGVEEVPLEKSYEVKLNKTGVTRDFNGISPALRKSHYFYIKERKENGKAGRFNV